MQGRENDWLRDVGAEHGRMVGSRKRLAHTLFRETNVIFSASWKALSLTSLLYGLSPLRFRAYAG
jgi:hypothetical protein